MSEKIRRIMLGFQSPVDRRLMRKYLTDLGYEVVESPDDTADIDLVLIDSGSARTLMQKAFKLKREAKYFLPVLVCINTVDNIGRWLNAGFDDVLPLPASKDKWRTRIAIMLQLRRQAEELGQKSEYLHRALIQSSSDHIFLLDANGTFVTSNNRVDHLGLNRVDKVVGRNIEQIYPKDVAAIYREQFQKVLTKGKTVIFEHNLTSNQGTYHHLDTLYPVNLPDGTVMVGGICRDITKHKQSEEELRVLETAINNAQECFMVSDREKRVTYVNRAFEKITGYSSGEILGKTPEILKKGRLNKEFYQNLKSTIDSGHPWQGNLTLKKKDGTDYDVNGTITPICDQAGTPKHFVSVFRDVTKERELEKRIQENQRLEAIGTLAGGIAHDFNNLLTPILGFADLSIRALPPGSKTKDNLQQILLAANRAKDLVQQILSFSRRSNQERKPLIIAPIIKEALKLIRSSIPSTIEIKEEICATTEIVVGNPTEIHQVVMNLCTNASHAMPDGGVLTVTLKTIDLDSDTPVIIPNCIPGRHLKLSVEDTGNGIPPEIMDKIFEPYFTTKGEGRGTGLGLAVTHSIVISSGGGITVDSQLGNGTRFDVYLPVAEVSTTDEEEKHAVIHSGHERILFVDDEPPVAELGKEMLESYGYSVTTCMDPVQALGLFKTEPGTFDMVITDITMPGLTGDQLAAALLNIRPDLPIIACTGFSERINKKKAQEVGIRSLLDKPFSTDILLSTIRNILDGEE